MSHDHCDHHHHHHHAHVEGGRGKLVWVLVLNMAFVILELGMGIYTGSSSLKADGWHNLSDSAGVALALWALWLAGKSRTEKHTFGPKGATTIAALGNGMLLALACGGVAWDAIHRLMEPTEIPGLTVAGVAAAGLFINGFSAWLLSGSGELNMRGAYLHMLADAAVSLGVVFAGVGLYFGMGAWVDPAVAICITLVIAKGAWGLSKEALDLAAGAVPKDVDVRAVEEKLLSLTEISHVEDLHVVGMGTSLAVLTAKIVIPSGYPGDAWMESVEKILKDDFGIGHSTLQMSLAPKNVECGLPKKEF